MALVPEVTNYVRALGRERLGAERVFYVARCFRDETACDAERLREFTQIGVEYLGVRTLDCRKVVRRDARFLFDMLFPLGGWNLRDGVKRGLNLYDDQATTFEIDSTTTRKQLLGGGTYSDGAGWALGLERLMIALRP